MCFRTSSLLQFKMNTHNSVVVWGFAGWSDYANWGDGVWGQLVAQFRHVGPALDKQKSLITFFAFHLRKHAGMIYRLTIQFKGIFFHTAHLYIPVLWDNSYQKGEFWIWKPWMNTQNADSERKLALHSSGSLHGEQTGFVLAKMATLLTSWWGLLGSRRKSGLLIQD